MRQPDTQIKLMNGSFSFNGYFDKLLNNYNRPSTAPSGFPWPTTAAYIQGFEILNVGGLSSITIDNSRKKEHDVFVRVVVHTVQGNFLSVNFIFQHLAHSLLNSLPQASMRSASKTLLPAK